MFTKTALDIGVLRNFIKTKVSPNIIRYARNGRDKGEGYFMPRAAGIATDKADKKYIMTRIRNHLRANPAYAADIRNYPGGPSAAYKDSLDMSRTATRIAVGNRDPNMPKHIVGGKYSWKNINKFLDAHGATKLNTGKAKNVFNDLILHHENNEMRAGKQFLKSLYGKGTPAKPTYFANSHLHPDVILKEHNAVSTLSGAPKDIIDNVKNRFIDMRNLGPENAVLSQYIPGGYGVGNRISRHARRRISDKIISNMDKGLLG